MMRLRHTWSWRSSWYEKINTPKVKATKTMPKSMLFHQNSNRYSYTKSRHAEGKCIKHQTEIDDFLSTWIDFAWFLTRFSTLVRPCNWFFGARNSKKRLARIRTLARLRRSVYGFEAVVITTPPPPRLRVKGVRFEVICKRTLEVDVVFDTQNSIRRRYVHHKRRQNLWFFVKFRTDIYPQKSTRRL